MPKLERLFVETYANRSALRLDWDNDRHQSVELERLDPDSVKQALLNMAYLIGAEQHNKYL